MGDIRAGIEDIKLDSRLFAEVIYYVSGEADPKIINLLQEGGAERCNYFSDYVSHLIAGFEALESDLSEAKEIYQVPAVTQDWILYSAKCRKLLPTHYFSPEEKQLFSNVKASISQVSRADSKALWAMITLQGGKCQLRLDSSCTHLIVTKTSGAKYEAALRNQIHVVTPDWVVECCRKGGLVGETEFHPRLLVYPSPNSSTALITGFMDEDVENNAAQEEQERNKAMLEQLKQRMPWNQQKSQPAVTSQAMSQSQNVTSTTSPGPAYNSTSTQNNNTEISDQSVQQAQQQLSQPQQGPQQQIQQSQQTQPIHQQLQQLHQSQQMVQQPQQQIQQPQQQPQQPQQIVQQPQQQIQQSQQMMQQSPQQHQQLQQPQQQMHQQLQQSQQQLQQPQQQLQQPQQQMQQPQQQMQQSPQQMQQLQQQLQPQTQQQQIQSPQQQMQNQIQQQQLQQPQQQLQQSLQQVQQSQQQMQPQQQQFVWTSTTSNQAAHATTSIPVSSVQNNIQQGGWNSPGVQPNNMLPMKSPTQQEVPTSQMNSQGLHQPQQLLNQQQELLQMPQQPPISQQQNINQQTIVSQQQQVNAQMLQHQLSSQQMNTQQQLMPQQQMVQHQQQQQQQMMPQQQMMSQQQMMPQQQMPVQQQMMPQQQMTSQAQQQMVTQQPAMISQAQQQMVPQQQVTSQAQMTPQQPMVQQPMTSQQQMVPQQQIAPQQQMVQQPMTSQQQMVPQQQMVQQQQIAPQQQMPVQQQMMPQQQVVSQQQINPQQHMGPQQQIQPQQQMVQQQLAQQQIMQQPISSQQQLVSQQPMAPQQQMVQQPMTSQQQMGPQQQMVQQPMTSQQQMVPQQQMVQQQQMTQQQLTNQQQLLLQKQQLLTQQVQQLNQQNQQMGMQQQQNPIQKQQQQLTPEQCQQMLLLQQQQKIQQISQQLQQSAPQSSQQFIVRENQVQQQSPTQMVGPNQQGFMVQRDAQWQQQQYQLQLQRQQQQQQIAGQQRPGAQWPQQTSQPPRQLIQLDAQTHQQLQQMDPQQRAQFIQKLQKHKTLFFQRPMQQRQQQGPHIAVVRSPGKPGQPGGIQWVSQPRPQPMGPQIAGAPGQKPAQMHPVVQQPPIGSNNQVVVQTSQAPQGAQQIVQNQQFPQGQPLTQQQIAQIQMQKQQQQIARMQQLQQMQQQQQQVGSQQQEPGAMTAMPGASSGQQMPTDQQLVVNAKTKTALANMLTNRLQSGTADGSAAGQLRLMTAQHRPPPPPSQDPQLLAAYQRRTLGNITNGAPPGGPVKMPGAPTAVQQPKAQFYGHNPNLKLPPDLFLLGCIFVIVEYDTAGEEVTTWKQVIEKHGGEIEPQYCARATHILAMTQKHPIVIQGIRDNKRCITAHWLSDVVIKQQVLPPWHALHFPLPFSITEQPCTKQIVSLSGFEGEERAKVKFMLEAIGAKFTKYFSRHNTLLICKRPEGPKYKKAREWQTGVVNAQWLTDLLCGHMPALHQLEASKYQQYNLGNPFRLDYSLVPHLMAAWKMPINITQESYDKVKQVGQGPNAMRKYKKLKVDVPLSNKDPQNLGLDEPITISNPNPPPPEEQPRILFSGISPKKHAKRIRELGGTLASSWKDATHLVMNAPLRTVKFLCCLSHCKYIVSLQWLLDCSAKNTFVEESAYTLNDPEFEKNFGCNIEKALASPNRGNILKGKIFYVTPSVVPSPSAMAEIIESAGGTVEKQRKSLAQIQEINNGKIDYIIITVENDLHLLADVLRADINVYSAEIVLGAIAKQSFQLDSPSS